MRYIPGRKPRRRPWPPRRKDDALFPGGDVRLLTSAPPCAFSGDRLPVSPGPTPPPQQSQPGQAPPTGQPDSQENRALRIEQHENAYFDRDQQLNPPNDAAAMPSSHASTELNFDERKEIPAPSPDGQIAPDETDSAPANAPRTNSMDTNPTYIDLSNPMPDEFAPDETEAETEIEAAAAAYRAAEKRKRAARKRELAAGRPTREELDRSAQLARFPLDSAKAAFASFAESTLHASPSAPPPDLARHSRRCTVCSHPDRDAIEAEFIRWRSPIRIAEEYGIVDRRSIYRHAQATGLIHRRRREASRVLEHVLERAESTPTEEFDVITRALRLYTHLDDDARFREPVRTHHVLHGQIAPPAANAIEVMPPGDPNGSLPK